MYELRYVKDKLFVAVISLISIVAIIPLFHIIITVILKGAGVVAEAGLRFITDSPPPPLSQEVGGIAPALVGSFLMTTISTPITVLIALLSAILSTELPGNPLSRIVDTLSRSLASIPTIIVSMTVYLLVVVPWKRFSMFAGITALTIITLPYAYTSFTSALRSVPRTYKEASLAIGFARWKTIFLVLIPIAKRAVLSGILITFARAMGETAALLFTVGRNRIVVNVDPFKPGDAIPLLIFDFISTPFKTYHEIAWGASLILLLTYLIVFFVSKIFVKEVKL